MSYAPKCYRSISMSRSLALLYAEDDYVECRVPRHRTAVNSAVPCCPAFVRAALETENYETWKRHLRAVILANRIVSCVHIVQFLVHLQMSRIQ